MEQKSARAECAEPSECFMRIQAVHPLLQLVKAFMLGIKKCTNLLCFICIRLENFLNC